MPVWRLSVWRLYVAYIGPNSRIENPRKTKIGTEVAHITRDSNPTFKVKRSKVNLQGAGAYYGGLPYSLLYQQKYDSFAMFRLRESGDIWHFVHRQCSVTQHCTTLFKHYINNMYNVTTFDRYTRSLATANRSRVSICDRPCKMFLTFSLITMQNLVVVSRGCAQVGSPIFGGCWGRALFERGRGWPLEIMFLPDYVSTPNSVILDETVWNRITACESNSRSMEPTQIDEYLWLPISEWAYLVPFRR